MGWELISYKPALEFANDLGYDLVALGIKPFSLEWAIFPAGMREEAKAAAETPGFKSLNFITENRASNATEQSRASGPTVRSTSRRTSGSLPPTTPAGSGMGIRTCATTLRGRC